MSVMHTLSNGARVVIDPMAGLETAALGVWVRAGSVDETAGEHGIAHLLEHMAFKGTTRRSAKALAEEIEAVGGYLNAATSQQRTGYYARVLKDDIGLGVDILADILKNPLFDEHELAKEREVVIQEIGEVADTPDDVVFELLTEICWKDQPLGRTILGTPDSVRAQTPASLRSFMERCYVPQDMVIAASGAVDEELLLEQLETAFGAFKSAADISVRQQPVFHGGLIHDPREIEQTHLAISFPGVASGDDDYFATRLYADILGGGMSSRLFQKVREERGLSYSVYAFADGYDHSGLFGAYVNAEENQIIEAADVIRCELQASAAPLEEAEVGRAKALLRSSLMMGLESPAARIEAAAGQVFVYGAVMSADEILARIDAITMDDLARCAERVRQGPCAISMVGPGDAGAVEALFKIS